MNPLARGPILPAPVEPGRRASPRTGSSGWPPTAPKPRRLEPVRPAIRVRHYSRRTEAAYIAGIQRFIFFHEKRHPAEMGEPEVNEFLSHLAIKEKVRASTQNPALSARRFLYRYVLDRSLGDLGQVIRARKPVRRPVVMTREEVQTVLSRWKGAHGLMAALRYGTGIRLTACLRLRVKDIDFGSQPIMVREGQGDKDRVTRRPERVIEKRTEPLDRIKKIPIRDLARWVWSRALAPRARAEVSERVVRMGMAVRLSTNQAVG